MINLHKRRWRNFTSAVLPERRPQEAALRYSVAEENNGAGTENRKLSRRAESKRRPSQNGR